MPERPWFKWARTLVSLKWSYGTADGFFILEFYQCAKPKFLL